MMPVKGGGGLCLWPCWRLMDYNAIPSRSGRSSIAVKELVIHVFQQGLGNLTRPIAAHSP